MRTIKFRGKLIDNSEWIYGVPINTHIGDYIVTEENPHVCSLYGYMEIDEFGQVDPDTVGQFTGLYDKNGKEIYEGDIIGCHDPEIKHLIFYNEKEGRFMAALNGDIENYFVSVCGLDNSCWVASKEVIGNIHDNPELLK